MKTNNYKIVAFDLDGTLTNPERGLVCGFEYALKKMKIDYGDRSLLTRFIGPPLRDAFIAEYGMSVPQATLAVEYFREYFSIYGWWDNEIYPEARDLLSALRASGKKIVLATSKPNIHSSKILKKFDIEKYFDFSLGASLDDTRQSKAEILDYAISSIGLGDYKNRNDAIMVGDRKYDIEGARKIGIASLGVLFGFGSREELTEAGADYIAKDFSELYDILL